MKTTSWPLNYPKSDSWPPRRPLPVVNSYINYPGLTIIIDCLTLTESQFNRKYSGEMVIMAHQILRNNIPVQDYESGDYDRGLLHRNNGITPFKRRAIVEFDLNLKPELRRLWRDLYQEVSTEDNLSILIDFSIASLRDSILDALTSGYRYDADNNGYVNLTEAGKSLSKKLAKARYLAESEFVTSRPGDYDQVIDKNYPNPPFRELGQDPEPFSRFILGKYPQMLFASEFPPGPNDDFDDFELESLELQCFTFKDAKAIAREGIYEDVGNFSPTWLAMVTGLPETIYNSLLIAAEHNERQSAIRVLVEQTCGFDDLVDEAIADDGFNLWMGYETSNEDDLYRIFGRDYLVGEV